MKRAAILVGVGAVMLVGLAGVAYAQQSTTAASTPSNFKYDIQGGTRVNRPDSTSVGADGSKRQEYRSGNCVKVKEVRADGAIKTSEKCTPR
jgi:hypothetical protein